MVRAGCYFRSDLISPGGRGVLAALLLRHWSTEAIRRPEPPARFAFAVRVLLTCPEDRLGNRMASFRAETKSDAIGNPTETHGGHVRTIGWRLVLPRTCSKRRPAHSALVHAEGPKIRKTLSNWRPRMIAAKRAKAVVPKPWRRSRGRCSAAGGSPCGRLPQAALIAELEQLFAILSRDLAISRPPDGALLCPGKRRLHGR